MVGLRHEPSHADIGSDAYDHGIHTAPSTCSAESCNRREFKSASEYVRCPRTYAVSARTKPCIVGRGGPFRWISPRWAYAQSYNHFDISTSRSLSCRRENGAGSSYLVGPLTAELICQRNTTDSGAAMSIDLSASELAGGQIPQFITFTDFSSPP